MGAYFFLTGTVIALVAISPMVSAGLTLDTEGLILNAGETRTFCDFFVFATQDGGVYHVQTSGEIREFTEKIEPNDFELRAIDCPEEREARISCKNYLCESGATEMCRQICIDFKAPWLVSLTAEPVEYQGTVTSLADFGEFDLAEPVSVSVFVMPVNAVPLIMLLSVVPVGGALYALGRRRQAPFKYRQT